MNELASVALKSTAVLGAAFLTAWVLRRRSAAARHLVWTAAFAALLALPLLSAWLPALPVPALVSESLVFRVTALVPDSLVFRTTAAASPAPATSEPRNFYWPWTLSLLWAAGAAVSLTRMAVGGVALRRMRRAARPAEVPDLLDLGRRLGIDHSVEVVETAPGTMPMTFGLFRPVVVLPAEAREWTEERRRLVLLHELAHVRRGDAGMHLLARAALALHWWNPLAWAAWREFLKERERAADDLVLNAGAGPAEYAGHLLEIARYSTAGYPAVAMARRPQLEGRLRAIMDAGRNRNAPRWAGAFACALLAAGAVAPLAALQLQADNAPSLINDGIEALRKLNYEQAFERLQRAGAQDPSLSPAATMWMAVARERQSRDDDADALYHRALAVADASSSEAATIMELHARLLGRLVRIEEAASLEKRASAVRKARAEPRPDDPGVYTMGPGITPPRLLSKVEPQYTEDARLARYEGTVVLSVEVAPDGRAHNPRILRGLGLGLNEQAIAAVQQWQFQPGLKDGQPVTVRATIEVNYRLY